MAASFTTPVLFTLASDLSRMQLQMDIDEADVGEVRQGQSASFLVDAFPNHHFSARLTALHNSPKTDNGVVTFPGILEVDNREGLLRPGLTANAEIMVATVHHALLVPNAALRFTPPIHWPCPTSRRRRTRQGAECARSAAGSGCPAPRTSPARAT